MNGKQRSVQILLIALWGFSLAGLRIDAAYAVDVCSSGVAEPPFLSFGVKSNLLLVIDNSGSMLDMAYTDPDGSQCFDDSYDTAEVYAGNFSASDNGREVWYEWVEGPYSAWQTATEYGDTNEPERVYVNGIIYEVQGACTSTGTFLINDTGCTWEKLIEVDIWQQGADYTAGEFVLDSKQLYLTENACTASAGNDITDDTGCTWEPVDHTWRSDKAYVIGDFVTYKGKYFEAESSAPAVGGVPGVDTAWKYLEEGSFVEIAGGVADVTTYCDSAGGGDSEYMADMCIRVDTTTTPSVMKAFAAKGSFLNWATASKFDIQKKILSGGKYDEDHDLIIGEHRGCAGRGYVKEIELDSAGDYLTMRVRGSFTEDGEPKTWDWVDSTDDTTRFEILGFSASGFDIQACQDAVDKIITVGSGFQNDVDNCLSGAGNDERSALNHALQYCWQDTHVRNLKTIADDCEGLYGALPPSGITAYNDAYNCYGIYDDSYDHDNRVGYVGRCWDTGTPAGASCDPYPRKQSDCNWTATGECEFLGTVALGLPVGELFRNSSGSVYTEICNEKKNATQCKNKNSWSVYHYETTTDNQCDPTDPAYVGAGAEWSDVLYPGPITDPTLDPDYDASVVPNNPGIGDGTVAEWWCIYQAMEDYCGDLKVPEVIDPSDQATTTTDYWNIPGNLIDAGVLSQLGIEQPLVVMKGFIEKTTAPDGILQEVKDDLRIGVMAFNDNGAKTECDAADTTDVIDNYCPGHTQDGAEVMSNIILGSTDVGGGREHIEDVVDSVNDTRATSWTPLAEAAFNAVGYFTQRTDMRLNDDDFQISAGAWTNATAFEIGDVVTWPDAAGDDVFYQATAAGTSSGTEPGDDTGVTWAQIENPDPVTNWCQENHILIITEGASTADINQDVIDFVDNAAINDGDQGADESCTGALNSSTYLDDLTYFAQNSDAANLYGANSTLSTGEDSDGDGLIDEKDKQNITTHIVVAGTLRDAGNTECSPDELIRNAATNGGTGLVLGENPEDLENNLLEKFNELRQRSSAGSAASVISSSRGGEGAIYQAIFWPELERTHQDGTEYKVDWVGDVHALFINDAGYMYEDSDGNRTMEPSEDIDGDGTLDVAEDTNQNGLLDVGEDIDGDGKLDVAEDINKNGSIDGNDLRVIIYFDESAGRSKACYNTLILDTGTCTNSKDLDDVKFLWEASEWLNDPTLLTASNRTYISDDKERYIFTWVDLNNNGIVDDDHDGTVDDDDEIRPFVEGLARDSSSNDLAVSGTRSPVYADFGVSSSDEVDSIISWSRGEDSLIDEDLDNDGVIDAGEDLNGNGRLDKIMRSRQIPSSEGGSTLITYRHEDTIHSTPMTVSEPAEAFHLLYRDRTYANFVLTHKERRHVIIYGKNNGMLSAVNGGFYKQDEKKFCLTSAEDASGNCDESAGNFPALGAELWSYVPYNMLPHLSCLTDEAYAHKYFVDLRPRIFDVKIFQEETECRDAGGNSTPTAAGCVHPDGWGTILVGGMRLGGAPANAYEVSVDPTDGLADDNRQFISSYFILDITNAEEPPMLLGELTQTLDNAGNQNFTDLGFSTAIPTMVTMKNPATFSPGTEANEWYLILGSGPHGADAMKGVSDQNAKVSVIPLSWLNATDPADSSGKTALRIPDAVPTSGTSGGTFTLAGSPNGFVSDLVTVDYDIDPSTFDYMADSVYFGTTEGDFITNADQTTEWNGGGKLYRLVTRPLSAGTSTYGTGVVQVPTTPDEWEIKPLIDLSAYNRPISSAPTVGYDGRNFWVYFGTGRFWHPDDKTDKNQQTYFGIKEPMTFNATTGKAESFLWETVEFTDNIDPATGADINMGTKPAGARGLLRVDDILVAQSSASTYAGLSCLDTTDTINGSPLAAGNLSCVPEVIRQGTSPDTAYFSELEKYIAGIPVGTCAADNADCTDGWYKDFWPYANRERNLGQGTLLGGLLTFTTYQPFSDVCQAEGEAYLYAVYYKTGTSWYENVFGEYGLDNYGNVENKLDLGRGLATTPNLHTGSGGGEGPRAFVQTSTGEIKEIQQENLPIKAYKSGRSKWKEYIP